MSIFYIAVDLSTTKIGLAIRNHSTLIYNEQVHFEPYADKVIYHNANLLFTKIKEIIKLTNINDLVLNLGIEVSNFSNPKLTQKFSTYAGAIIALLSQYYQEKINIKIFAANAWQLKVPGIKNDTERKERKELTKQYAINELNTSDKLSEDEYDAIVMCYFYDEIISTSDSLIVHIENKKRAKQNRINTLKQKSKINQQIAKLYEKQLSLKQPKSIEKNALKIAELQEKLKIK